MSDAAIASPAPTIDLLHQTNDEIANAAAPSPPKIDLLKQSNDEIAGSPEPSTLATTWNFLVHGLPGLVPDFLGHDDVQGDVDRDQFFRGTAVGRVLDAFGHGAADNWGEGGAFGLPPEVDKWMRDTGILTKDGENPWNSTIKAFNTVILRGGAQALELAFRAPMAAWFGVAGAIGQTAEETGLAHAVGLPGSDLARSLAQLPFAVLPEARMRLPEEPIPAPLSTGGGLTVKLMGPAARAERAGQSAGAEPALPPLLKTAHDLNVIGPGGEDAWRNGTVPAALAEGERSPAEIAAAADAKTAAKEGAGTTQGQEEAPPTPKATVDDVARQIDPDTMQQWESLQTRQNTYRTWLSDLDAGRRAQAEQDSPFTQQITSLGGQIGDLEARLGDTTPRLAKKYVQRIADLQAQLDEVQTKHDDWVDDATSGDNADMARVRQALIQNDYKMRDMSPAISDLYRRAQEQLSPDLEEQPITAAASAPPEEPIPVSAEEGRSPPTAEPEAAPIENATAEGAEPTPITPAAVEAAGPAPNVVGAGETTGGPTTPEHVAAIHAEVARQLVAAGRPADEAEAAAAIVSSHYEARAERFGGAKGNALALFRNEAPAIRAARGSAKSSVMGLAQEAGPKFEPGAEGKLQQLISGVEPTAPPTDKERIAATAAKPLRGGNAPLPEEGLFGERRQGELFQTKRGSITFAGGKRPLVKLFADADASTFMHETGHAWLEELMRDAADGKAPDDLKADAATVRKWLGAEDGEALNRAQHEKFAKGFEQYLYTGSAPTERLAKVFEQFKNWLRAIYDSAKRLGAPISDDARDVFDRLVTKEPVERQPVGADAPPAKMLADIHEADAEHTPPERAPEVRDIVQGEMARTADAAPPLEEDVNAGDAGAGAGEAGAGVADSAEPGGAGAEPGEPSAQGAGRTAGSPEVGGGAGEAEPEGTGLRNGAAAKPARARRIYEKLPRQPTRLTDFVRRLGGVTDVGGDVKAIIVDARARPGLISASGVDVDEAARAAGEAGYFPETGTERPTVRQFLEKLESDLRGTPQYSDFDRDAALAYHEAVGRNAEIDRLANELGIDLKGITKAEFWNRVSEHLSLEKASADAQSQAEAAEAAFLEAERAAEAELGDAWKPDSAYEGTPRTLEDMENERRQEEASRYPGEGEGGAGPPESAAGGQGEVQEGAGSRGNGAGVAGRHGAQTEPPADPNGRFEPAAPDDRLFDKAGNIRLDNLNRPQDIKQVLRDMAAANSDFMEERGGVQLLVDQQAAADALGLDAQTFDPRRPAGVSESVWLRAIKDLTLRSATAVRDAMVRLKDSGSDDDAGAFAKALARHQMIQGEFSRAKAESGRALAANRWDDARALIAGTARMAEEATGMTLNQLKSMARDGAALDTPAKVSRFVEQATKPRLRDKVQFVALNGLISGPVTHMTYEIAAWLTVLEESLLERPLAAAYGSARDLVGKPTPGRVYWAEVGASVYGALKGGRDGVRAALEAWRSNLTTPLPGEAGYAPLFGGPEGKNLPPAFESGIAKHRNPFESEIGHRVGEIIGVPGRAITALHSFNRNVYYGMSIASQAVRGADDLGLTGQSRALKIAQLTRTPTDEMMTTAIKYANDLAYMKKPEYGSAMYHIERFANTNLATKIVLPFMRVGANIIERAYVERTPIGLITKQTRDNLLGKNGPAAADFARARMTAGVLIAGTLMGLAVEGLATGQGPTDDHERDLWLVNHRPYSIRIGDTWVPYKRLGHIGMLMGLGANLAEVAHIASHEGMEAGVVQLAHAIASNVVEESWMAGLSNLLNALEEPASAKRFLYNLGSEFVPFSAFMRQAANALDPYMRAERGTAEQFQNMVPIWRNQLPPRRDIWGEPIPSSESAPYAVLAAPFQRGHLDDPVDGALAKIGSHPAPPQHKIRGVDLTGQQYDDYSRVAGRYKRAWIERLVGSPGWAAMPDGIKRQVASKVYTSANEAASAAIMMKYPGIIAQATAAKLQALQ